MFLSVESWSQRIRTRSGVKARRFEKISAWLKGGDRNLTPFLMPYWNQRNPLKRKGNKLPTHVSDPSVGIYDWWCESNDQEGCSFCISSSPFPLGHQSTHPLGDRCFVGLLGIQVVIEGQLSWLPQSSATWRRISLWVHLFYRTFPHTIRPNQMGTCIYQWARCLFDALN